MTPEEIVDLVKQCSYRWNATLPGKTEPALVTDFKMPTPAVWKVFYVAENHFRVERGQFTEEIFRQINDRLKAGDLEPLGPLNVSSTIAGEYTVRGYIFSPDLKGAWRWVPSVGGVPVPKADVKVEVKQ